MPHRLIEGGRRKDRFSALTSEAGPSTQARVKAAYEFTAQPRLGNGRGALERWPRKQALTIGRGAGTEQRGEVGPSHDVERIADRNVGKRHPPRRERRPEDDESASADRAG